MHVGLGQSISFHCVHVRLPARVLRPNQSGSGHREGLQLDGHAMQCEPACLAVCASVLAHALLTHTPHLPPSPSPSPGAGGHAGGRQGHPGPLQLMEDPKHGKGQQAAPAGMRAPAGLPISNVSYFQCRIKALVFACVFCLCCKPWQPVYCTL